MSYCNPGEKPTITYTFGNGTQRKHISNVSPVEVTTGNANETGSRIRIESYAYGCNESPCKRVRGVFPGEVGTQNIPYIVVTFCDGTDYLLLVKENASIQYIDGEKCSVADNTCKIEVKNTSGAVIFRDIGQCPINYDVQCGRCPEG